MRVKKIGMIGLGPMGKSLSLNMMDKSIEVMGYDIDKNARDTATKEGMKVVDSLKALTDFFDGEKKAIWMMVPASKVDDVLREVSKYLSLGDILIEGGNSHFKDTERRVKEAKEKGLGFIGTGISGGEEGALKGPCIMPGGDRDAYDAVEPILKAIAVKINGEPCCTYIGPGGAGHFVKMVHNGIEYAIMQVIAEAYYVLKEGLGLETEKIHKLFREWTENQVMSGYLMEISTEILGTKDRKTGRPIIEVIKDTAKQKGTGKWTSQEAYDLGVPVHSISAALLARIISAYRDERIAASSVLEGPDEKHKGDKDKFAQHMSRALDASIRMAYAQGFALIRAGSKEYNYDLKPSEIARIWRGGCIIRSKLLPLIEEAFTENPDLTNLLIVPQFSEVLNDEMSSLRYVVQTAISCGIPVPVLSQSITYFDSYRAKVLPAASFIQAMRDFFGAHTYERFDEPGVYHTLWTQEGRPEYKK